MANQTITDYSDIGTPANDDEVLAWDKSVGATKKITFANFIAGLTAATLLRDGSVSLTADWDIGASRFVAAEKFRARSSAGLRLEDDGGNLGAFIEDATGCVGLGTTTISGGARLTVSGALRADYDSNVASYLGRARIGYDGATSDWASFGHIDQAGASTALWHTNAGATWLNAATGQQLNFAIAGSALGTWHASNGFRVGYDSNMTSYFGRAAVGYSSAGGSDVATFGHIDRNGDYPGVAQYADGHIDINVPSGEGIYVNVGGATVIYTTGAPLLNPFGNGTTTLGDSTHKWSEVWASNGTIQTSDVREKDDVAVSDLGLTFIRALAPIRWRFHDRVRPHYGLSAQQVRAALDELGVADFAGYIHDPATDVYALRYSEFTGPLVAAVQELADQVDRLTGRLERLEKEWYGH